MLVLTITGQSGLQFPPVQVLVFPTAASHCRLRLPSCELDHNSVKTPGRNEKTVCPMYFPSAASVCYSGHIQNSAQNLSFQTTQTSGHQSQGRAPLKVTMGRQRREQKVGWRGWIWAEVRDFLSLQSVELSGL